MLADRRIESLSHPMRADIRAIVAAMPNQYSFMQDMVMKSWMELIGADRERYMRYMVDYYFQRCIGKNRLFEMTL